MDNEHRLHTAIEKLRTSVSSLSTKIEILSSKQAETLAKINKEAARMDDYASRLRKLESTQQIHKAYFALLGTGMGLCAAGLIQLLFS